MEELEGGVEAIGVGVIEEVGGKLVDCWVAEGLGDELGSESGTPDADDEEVFEGS